MIKVYLQKSLKSLLVYLLCVSMLPVVGLTAEDQERKAFSILKDAMESVEETVPKADKSLDQALDKAFNPLPEPVNRSNVELDSITPAKSLQAAKQIAESEMAALKEYNYEQQGALLTMALFSNTGKAFKKTLTSIIEAGLSEHSTNKIVFVVNASPIPYVNAEFFDFNHKKRREYKESIKEYKKKVEQYSQLELERMNIRPPIEQNIPVVEGTKIEISAGLLASVKSVDQLAGQIFKAMALYKPELYGVQEDRRFQSKKEVISIFKSLLESGDSNMAEELNRQRAEIIAELSAMERLLAANMNPWAVHEYIKNVTQKLNDRFLNNPNHLLARYMSKGKLENIRTKDAYIATRLLILSAYKAHLEGEARGQNMNRNDTPLSTRLKWARLRMKLYITPFYSGMALQAPMAAAATGGAVYAIFYPQVLHSALKAVGETSTNFLESIGVDRFYETAKVEIGELLDKPRQVTGEAFESFFLDVRYFEGAKEFFFNYQTSFLVASSMIATYLLVRYGPQVAKSIDMKRRALFDEKGKIINESIDTSGLSREEIILKGTSGDRSSLSEAEKRQIVDSLAPEQIADSEASSEKRARKTKRWNLPSLGQSVVLVGRTMESAGKAGYQYCCDIYEVVSTKLGNGKDKSLRLMKDTKMALADTSHELVVLGARLKRSGKAKAHRLQQSSVNTALALSDFLVETWDTTPEKIKRFRQDIAEWEEFKKQQIKEAAERASHKSKRALKKGAQLSIQAFEVSYIGVKNGSYYIFITGPVELSKYGIGRLKRSVELTQLAGREFKKLSAEIKKGIEEKKQLKIATKDRNSEDLNKILSRAEAFVNLFSNENLDYKSLVNGLASFEGFFNAELKQPNRPAVKASKKSLVESYFQILQSIAEHLRSNSALQKSILSIGHEDRMNLFVDIQRLYGNLEYSNRLKYSKAKLEKVRESFYESFNELAKTAKGDLKGELSLLNLYSGIDRLKAIEQLSIRADSVRGLSSKDKKVEIGREILRLLKKFGGDEFRHHNEPRVIASFSKLVDKNLELMFLALIYDTTLITDISYDRVRFIASSFVYSRISEIGEVQLKLRLSKFFDSLTIIEKVAFSNLTRTSYDHKLKPKQYAKVERDFAEFLVTNSSSLKELTETMHRLSKEFNFTLQPFRGSIFTAIYESEKFLASYDDIRLFLSTNDFWPNSFSEKRSTPLERPLERILVAKKEKFGSVWAYDPVVVENIHTTFSERLKAIGQFPEKTNFKEMFDLWELLTLRGVSTVSDNLLKDILKISSNEQIDKIEQYAVNKGKVFDPSLLEKFALRTIRRSTAFHILMDRKDFLKADRSLLIEDLAKVAQSKLGNMGISYINFMESVAEEIKASETESKKIEELKYTPLITALNNYNNSGKSELNDISLSAFHEILPYIKKWSAKNQANFLLFLRGSLSAEEFPFIQKQFPKYGPERIRMMFRELNLESAIGLVDMYLNQTILAKKNVTEGQAKRITKFIIEQSEDKQVQKYSFQMLTSLMKAIEASKNAPFQSKVLSALIAMKHEQTGSAGETLKVVLEQFPGVGPKIAQFLVPTGKLPKDVETILRGTQDNTLPPRYAEMYADASAMMRGAPVPFRILGNVGSGSMKYTYLALEPKSQETLVFPVFREDVQYNSALYIKILRHMVADLIRQDAKEWAFLDVVVEGAIAAVEQEKRYRNEPRKNSIARNHLYKNKSDRYFEIEVPYLASGKGRFLQADFAPGMSFFELEKISKEHQTAVGLKILALEESVFFEGIEKDQDPKRAHEKVRYDADRHAGNYLIEVKEKDANKMSYKIWPIDFGQLSVIRRGQRKKVVELLSYAVLASKIGTNAWLEKEVAELFALSPSDRKTLKSEMQRFFPLELNTKKNENVIFSYFNMIAAINRSLKTTKNADVVKGRLDVAYTNFVRGLIQLNQYEREIPVPQDARTPKNTMERLVKDHLAQKLEGMKLSTKQSVLLTVSNLGKRIDAFWNSKEYQALSLDMSREDLDRLEVFRSEETELARERMEQAIAIQKKIGTSMDMSKLEAREVETPSCRNVMR